MTLSAPGRVGRGAVWLGLPLGKGHGQGRWEGPVWRVGQSALKFAESIYKITIFYVRAFLSPAISKNRQKLSITRGWGGQGEGRGINAERKKGQINLQDIKKV